MMRHFWKTFARMGMVIFIGTVQGYLLSHAQSTQNYSLSPRYSSPPGHYSVPPVQPQASANPVQHASASSNTQFILNLLATHPIPIPLGDLQFISSSDSKLWQFLSKKPKLSLVLLLGASGNTLTPIFSLENGDSIPGLWDPSFDINVTPKDKALMVYLNGQPVSPPIAPLNATVTKLGSASNTETVRCDNKSETVDAHITVRRYQYQYELPAAFISQIQQAGTLTLEVNKVRTELPSQTLAQLKNTLQQVQAAFPANTGTASSTYSY